MYSVSNNYKNHIKTNLSLSPKCKIIVDNVIYTGSVIKTAPKIVHNCDRPFGEFPTKKVNFEIYDLNNNLNFENKEITVYKGLYINDQTEWILQGIFKPNSSNITTNISTRTITIQDARDRTQLFDVPYVSGISWDDNQTHTGLEIVSDVCTQIGIELTNTDFNLASYQFKQPNFSKNITCREVICRFVEIGNSIAFCNREGRLEIKSRTATNETIERKRYVNLSKENIVGPYNTLIFGKDGYNDDIIYPETIDTDRIEVKILDNPFVDLYREEMIETIASYFIGSSCIPFELTDFVDGFYYDLNDEIEVIDKNGNKFKSIILNYETTSRIKSKVGADTKSKSSTDYNLAGSNRSAIEDVKLDVNHIKSEINLVATKNEENSEKIAAIEIKNNEITSSVSEISNNLDNMQDSISGDDGLLQRVHKVETKQTSQEYTINVISTNIDKTNGNIQEVTTTNGYKFNSDGMSITSSEDDFNALHNSKGTFYKDGDTILTQFTKDNTITKDMVLYGKYYYGVDEDLNVADFNKDDAMFIAEKYIDGNGEEGFGHFFNKGE